MLINILFNLSHISPFPWKYSILSIKSKLRNEVLAHHLVRTLSAGPHLHNTMTIWTHQWTLNTVSNPYLKAMKIYDR
jgi:hypothetical protein